MTQYVMFQSTPEIEEAVIVGNIYALTPNKVYEQTPSWSRDIILDDDDCAIEIIAPERNLTCPHLRGLAQWQYCDVDGNIL